MSNKGEEKYNEPFLVVNVEGLNARMNRLKGIDAGNKGVSQPRQAARVIINPSVELASKVTFNDAYASILITSVGVNTSVLEPAMNLSDS